MDLAKIIKLITRLLAEKKKLDKKSQSAKTDAPKSTEVKESKPAKSNSFTQSSGFKKFALIFFITSASILVLLLIIIAIAPES